MYERHAGQIGPQNDSETLIQIREFLELLLNVTISANGGKPTEFKPVERPWWVPAEDETEEEADAKRVAELTSFARLLKK